MIGVRDYLRKRRKAELQTIHQFWYPGESRLTTRAELEKRVAQALTGGLQLGERVARLTKTQRSLLETLLQSGPEFAVGIESVSSRLQNIGSAPLEIDSAARMLLERGFIDRRRLPLESKNDVYQIPAELASRLEEVLNPRDGRIAPGDQLSQKRLPFEIDFDESSLEDRIATLTDPHLRALVEFAIEMRGLLEFGSSTIHDGVVERCGEDVDVMRADWKHALESAGIGTIAAIHLEDFGIVTQTPCLVMFQEWMQRHYRARLASVPEPDTVGEAGVDLYIDLDRIATRLETESPRLTRDGRVPKRMHDHLESQLYLPRIGEHLEGDLTGALLNMAARLGLVEKYAGAIRVDGDRLRHWRKLDLLQQVDVILERFISESRGGRWSFHQELLRQILLDTLREVQPDDWLAFDSLIGLVVSTYMLELEEREVRECLKQRREADFSRERLTSSFSRLATDLTYWVVNRFLPLGLCEVGYSAGRLTAFRLTALGKESLGIAREPRESRILVNPNFEIMLFCEGLRGMRLELALSRFGERVSAERVRRYLVTRDSMREGIRSGLSLAQIRQMLEEASDHPLPDSVLVSLEDWGKDLDWIDLNQAVLVTGVRSERCDEICDHLAELGYDPIACTNGSIAVVVRTGTSEDNSRMILRELRQHGWLVRECLPDQPALRLDDDSDMLP